MSESGKKGQKILPLFWAATLNGDKAVLNGEKVYLSVHPLNPLYIYTSVPPLGTPREGSDTTGETSEDRP